MFSALSPVGDAVSLAAQKVGEYLPTPSLPTTQGALAAVAIDAAYRELTDLPTDLVKSRLKEVFRAACYAFLRSTAGKVVMVAGAAFLVYSYFPWGRKGKAVQVEIPLFGSPKTSTHPVEISVASGPSGEMI